VFEFRKMLLDKLLENVIYPFLFTVSLRCKAAGKTHVLHLHLIPQATAQRSLQKLKKAFASS